MGEPSVLVVEDEQNVRYIAAAALRLAGFAVSELATGRDALGHLADAGAACDLVVLDVLLPDVDGLRSAGGCERPATTSRSCSSPPAMRSRTDCAA